MAPRDYVDVDMSEQIELNNLDAGQPFIVGKFLCVEVSNEYHYFDDDVIPANHAVCFCFNTSDIMFVSVFDRVQPVRKIKVEIINV